MRTKRILMIDGEPVVRDVVTRILDLPGYHIEAPAVEEHGPPDIAWQNAVTGRYDILLLDLRLPTFDSFELLDCLATIDSPTRPIALAGFLPEMIRADLRDHGCRHFVEKPFKSADLIREIDSCALSPA